MADEPFVTERCSSGPELDARFPLRERLYAYEGGVLFGAKATDGYCLISEWQLADGPDNVTLYRFPDFATAEAWHDGPRSPAHGRLRERLRSDNER